MHEDAFLGTHGSPGRLELDAPTLQEGPTGLLKHFRGLRELKLTIGTDFVVENGTCGFFDGLNSLVSLTVLAQGA